MQLLKSNKFMRAAAMTLAVAVTAVMLYLSPLSTAGASTYREQIDALKNKQSETQAKIDSVQSDINDQQKLMDALQSKINLVQAQIDVYNEQIEQLNDEIDASQKEKAALVKSLNERKATFMKRLRAMYMSGDASTLSLLLSADDFGDFLYKYQLLSSVTEYDSAAIDGIKADIDRVKQLEASLKSDKAEVSSLADEEKSKKSELDSTMEEYNAVREKLVNKKSALQDNLSEYGAAIDDLEAEIQQAAEEARNASQKSDNDDGNDGGGGSYGQSSPVFDGGQFICPLGDFSFYVSSEFGPRWGRNHNGLDLAGSGIYGAPIYAACSGTVILAGWDGSGYGNYIMINHGNNSDGDNFTTLYGHCSSVSVSSGQHVEAGEIIGHVGSTGYSTGPHLHFEIRVNGVARNPRNYRSF